MAAYRYDDGDYRPMMGGFSFFPPVIKSLIVVNVICFLIQLMTESGFTVGELPLAQWFADLFYLQPIGYGFYPWQLVTYMFLHGDLWHIVLNMLMLWMFGMEVENNWGSRRFLAYYFTAGIFAGLTTLFIAPLFSPPAPTIGASGSVYGVLVAFAMMFPNRPVYLYFFLPIRAKYLVTFFILLELYNGVTGAMGGIAHMAHLGGAVVGAIWVLLERNGILDRWFPPRAQRRMSPSRWTGSSTEAVFHDLTPTPPRPHENDEYQQMIDRILDKISKSGYAGLTEEEKRILLDAGRRMRHHDPEAQ